MSSEEDTKRSLRRQLEEKSDIVDRLQLEIQQLVDRINSMETQHSVELGRFHSCKHWQLIKPAFHDADTDILARIVARMSARRSACRGNNFRKSRACRRGCSRGCRCRYRGMRALDCTLHDAVARVYAVPASSANDLAASLIKDKMLSSTAL